MQQTMLTIEGMSCGHCVNSVQSVLQAVPGVSSATVELQPGKANVRHDGTVTVNSLIDAVAEAGYQAKAAQ